MIVKLGIENFNLRSYIMVGFIYGLCCVVGFNWLRGGGGWELDLFVKFFDVVVVFFFWVFE